MPNTSIEGIDRSKRRYPAVLPLIVITAAVTLVIGIGLGLAQANVQPPDSGKAPDFSVTTFDGQPFRMSDQHGKVTVLNFWASWCDTCPAETPLLNALYADYHDRGVSVIAVTYLDNHSDSLAFMKQYAIRYPTAPDDGSRASAAFRIHQVPETYLIDQNGNIVYAVHNQLDSTSAQTLRTKIDQLLNAPKTT